MVGLRDEASLSFKEYFRAHIQALVDCCASTDWKDCFKSRCEIYAEIAKGNVLIDFQSFFFFPSVMLYIGWGFYTELNQKEICRNIHKRDVVQRTSFALPRVKVILAPDQIGYR